MNKLISKIAFIASASLLLIAGLAFFFLDTRILVTGEWLAYSDPAFGFVQLLLKDLIWLSLMAGLPLTIVYLKKNTEGLRMLAMVYAVFIFVMGVVSAIIFKTDAGEPLLYYMLPAAILPCLYALSFFYYETESRK